VNAWVLRFAANNLTIGKTMTGEQQQPIVLIAREELMKLKDYSMSLPSGTTIGKRWRKSDGKGGWKIGEYVPSLIDGIVNIKWSQVQLLEDLHDEAKHVDNLETLVVRLARYIEKTTDGDSKFAEQAMEYMRRQARGSQSILRAASR